MIVRPLPILLLIIFGMFGGWLGFMVNDRQVPVRFYATEVTNSPQPGTALRVRSTVWRDKSCNTRVFRAIYDKDNRRFVTNDLDFPAGVLPIGNDTFVAPIPISLEAEPGPAVYRVHRKYRCNVLQWIFPVEDGPHDYQFTIAAK
jgi:hypothetical protein